MSQTYDSAKPESGVTTFGQLYQILRDHIAACVSSFSGTVFPSNPAAGQPCFRTDRGTAGVWYFYSGNAGIGENGWIEGLRFSIISGFRAYHSAAQNLVTGDNQISFGSEEYDSKTEFASSKFTAAEDGIYLFSCGIKFQNPAAQRAGRLFLKKGSSEIDQIGIFTAPATGPCAVYGAALIKLAASDEITVHINTDGAISTDAGQYKVFFAGTRTA